MTCSLIDSLDSLLERDARWQSAIGLGCEADDRRTVCLLGGEDYANRLIDIGHRDGRDHIDACADQRIDLVLMVAASFICRHLLTDGVAISARPEVSADEHWRLVLCVLIADRLHQLYSISIERFNLLFVVSEFSAPVTARTPGWRLENEAAFGGEGNIRVTTEVRAQRFATRLVFQEVECRKAG